jgi:hypothetical protein
MRQPGCKPGHMQAHSPMGPHHIRSRGGVMSRKITSDICFGLLTTILLTGGAWPQNAAAQSASGSFHRSGEWTTHAHDAQHTGVSPVASQKLAKIHWQVPVDLAPPESEILIHYGSPLVTAKNTATAKKCGRFCQRGCVLSTN